MIEGETNRVLPEDLPTPVVHRLSADAEDLGRPQFTKEKILDFLRQVQERPENYATNFALDLEKAGLVSGLEEIGILPPAGSSIANEISSEEDQNEQTIGERKKALNNLYIGTVLGHLFDELFPQK